MFELVKVKSIETDHWGLIVDINIDIFTVGFGEWVRSKLNLHTYKDISTCMYNEILFHVSG